MNRLLLKCGIFFQIKKDQRVKLTSNCAFTTLMAYIDNLIALWIIYSDKILWETINEATLLIVYILTANIVK